MSAAEVDMSRPVADRVLDALRKAPGDVWVTMTALHDAVQPGIQWTHLRVVLDSLAASGLIEQGEVTASVAPMWRPFEIYREVRSNG